MCVYSWGILPHALYDYEDFGSIKNIYQKNKYGMHEKLGTQVLLMAKSHA
jgi:hypothetical protein